MKPTYEGRARHAIYISDSQFKRLEALASPNERPNDLIRKILDQLDFSTARIAELEEQNQSLRYKSHD